MEKNINELNEFEQGMLVIANAHRLALLALFDAVAEMVDVEPNELRMRFMHHLHGRASSQHPEARLLREVAAQLEQEVSAHTTADTARSRPI